MPSQSASHRRENRFSAIHCGHRIVCLLTAAFLFALPAVSSAAADTFTVVIDAGHGGKDPGAVNGKNQEKAINLAVALCAGRLIEKNCPDVKVIYTRKTDVFVELNRRAQIANDADADLFISIHTNAAGSSSAYGAETYLLGAEENRTSANLSVAMQENQVITFESDYRTEYAGYDPGSTESQIIFEFIQNEHQQESLQLASLAQKQLTGYAGRRDRGVHQAGFLVLWKNAMPSILIELGYISNSSDMKYMMSDKGREQLGTGIAKAVEQYIESTRRQKAEIASVSTAVTPEPPAASHKASTQTAVDDAPVFKVQFLTSETVLPENSARLKGLSDVSYYRDGKLYKYTSGATGDYEEARKIMKTVRATYKDAFIVAFRGGVRTDLQEAVKTASKKSPTKP